MDITANDFFRQQYFAATWNKEQMNKTTMSPNDCIKMMELYHEYKLKLLGIANVSQQRELLRAYHTYLLTHTDKEECNHTIEGFLIARNSG